jgi:hypothetical protein
LKRREYAHFFGFILEMNWVSHRVVREVVQANFVVRRYIWFVYILFDSRSGLGFVVVEMEIDC